MFTQIIPGAKLYSVDSSLQNGVKPCIHYSVNGVHVGICCWISNTKMRRFLTVLVGCGMVGNSSRSSDLLMAPVSRYRNLRDKGEEIEIHKTPISV